MTGTWHIATNDKPMLQLTTKGMPMTLAVKAPITAGTLSIANDTEFFLELALLKMEAANLAAKFGVGAARDLIKKHGGDVLTFEATANGVSGPWELAGTAYAGSLEIPTAIVVTPAAEMKTLHIGGTITMDDIEIPLPGMSGVNSITFVLDGKAKLRTS